MIAKPHSKNSLSIAILISSLFLLFLYRFTAPKGTTPEDASEFILTSQFLGLPHPPGYPLFVWLGHFFSLFPLGSPAQQVAFLSCLCLAMTSGLLGYWAFQRSHRISLAVWTCLTYGLSTFSWSSAEFVEVYPLHTFLMTLTFFLFYQLTILSDCITHRSLIFLTGLCLGFSLSNHYPLVVLTFPALFFLIYSNKKVLFSSFFFKWIGLGILLGLLPYAYLFFAERFSEYLFSGPIRTFSDFFDYVTRKEYAQNDRSKVFSFYELALYFWVAIKMMARAFTPVVFVSFLVSLFYSIKNRSEKDWIIALSLGLSSSFFLLFLFWQPDYYLLAIELYQSFHGFALACFLLIALSPIERLLESGYWKKGIYFALITIPTVLFLTNLKANDRRTDTFTKDYAEIVFSSLPPRSVLLVKGDADAGLLAYYHFLEKMRPDITVTSQVAALLPNKLFDRKFDIPKNNHQVALLNFISSHLAIQKPVFSIGPVEYFSSNHSPFPLKTKDYGLFREIYEDDPPPTRDLNLIKDKGVTFLNKVMSATYEPNFIHYRDRLISSVCHTLLILEVDHPAFEQIPRCQIIKAQWLHVEKKDYTKADGLFRSGLAGLQDRQNSELSDIGKDFFLNRMKMIDLIPVTEKSERDRLVRETVDISLPLALNFPVCKSNLAKKVYDLCVRSGLVLEAQELRTTFSHCPIETVPHSQ